MRYFFKYRAVIFYILGIIATIPSYGQYFMTGQEPASVRWKQINSENFQMIFPEDFSEKAQYVANILEYSYGRVSYSLNHQPRKVSVIIHNLTVSSNGFVAPAPHRMELYSVPPQDNLTMPWLEHLCIHELRHFVQIDKLNQGLTKVLGYLFGQQANAVVAGLIPMWYLEGDAVISETALTDDGRGRVPGFSRVVRSRLSDSLASFSFDKMLLGSYKNNTPNHYELGYHMTTYARIRHGSELWQNVEHYVSRKPFWPLSFNSGLKRYAGYHIRELYDSAMTFYEGYYFDNPKQTVRNKRIVRTEPHEDYTSYRYPQYLEDGDILALKKDYSRLPRFIRISDGEELVVHIPGRLSFDRFSYAKDQIVWSEVIPDVRWPNRSYSVIKLYDMRLDRERSLTEKTRLFAPDISSDGEKIAAIRVTRENQYHLTVLDHAHGWVQEEFTHPDGIFIQQPAWSVDGKYIYVIGTAAQGKGIYRVHYRSGEWEQILKPSSREVQHLSPGTDYIYLKAALEHKEEICALDPASGELFRVTHSQTNASDVCKTDSSNSILYADFQAEGYNLVEKHLDKGEFESIDSKVEDNQCVIKAMRKGEDQLFHSEAIPKHQYNVEPYSKWKNLFHFHSWAPLYMDYSITQKSISDVAPGITLFSQNLLSTALTTLGYSYESGTHKLHSQFVYKGWYPVFKLSSNYGGKPDVIRHSSVNWSPGLSNNYMNFNASVSLPLNLTEGKYISGFTPTVSYDYNRNYYHNYQEDYYLRGLKTLDYNLWFYYYQRLAYRDLIPRWGVTFDLNLRSSPFSENILGNMTTLAGRFYLPGFIEDHGIKLMLGYQRQDTEAYFYSSYQRFPRGFHPSLTQKLFSVQADYAFPLFYPDWNIPSVLYVKRFKADLFQDYALNQYQNVQNNRKVWVKDALYSIGTEITSDFHIARIMFPLSAGVRYAYLPQLSGHRFEMIFNVDFYRIYSNMF